MNMPADGPRGFLGAMVILGHKYASEAKADLSRPTGRPVAFLTVLALDNLLHGRF